MEHAAKREREEKLLASNTKFGPHNMVAFLRFFEIIVGIIYFHLPNGVITQARGVEGGVLFALIWRTRQSKVDFGHSSGSP